MASWADRNARARAAGYESYYDYRAHDYGRLPPSAPRATGDELARLRGHRSTADFVELMASGRAELVNAVASKRDARGRVIESHVLVTDSKGRRREFVLRGAAVLRPARAKIRRVMRGLDPGAVLVVGSAGALKALGLE